MKPMSLQFATARESGETGVYQNPDTVLEILNAAVFGANEPITITVNPDADGGWGEAPQPTITWDERSA